MAVRRHGTSRKKTKALGDFISADVRELRDLAGRLNGENPIHARVDGTPAGPREAMIADPLVMPASEIVEGALGTSYPDVPKPVGERFNSLARPASLHYVVDVDGVVRPGDGFRFAF